MLWNSQFIHAVAGILLHCNDARAQFNLPTTGSMDKYINVN
jgi:hypothetical protein